MINHKTLNIPKPSAHPNPKGSLLLPFCFGLEAFSVQGAWVWWGGLGLFSAEIRGLQGKFQPMVQSIAFDSKTLLDLFWKISRLEITSDTFSCELSPTADFEIAAIA